MAVSKTQETIDIIKIQKPSVILTVRGTTPLIINRMSEKARHELLLPKGRKTAADKASSLKHNPIDEFKASPYIIQDDTAPSLIALTAETFKAAMGTAALDLPGANKSQIGRLVYVEADPSHKGLIPIYGEPKLLMSVTRSADINHTPDIRTRVIVPQWAARIRVSFVAPALRQLAIVNLMAAAGVTAGVGDWRPQKGKGSFGQFDVVDAEDQEVARLMSEWGRSAQIAAMDAADPYDHETEELLTWFRAEAPRRGFEVVA